jgi:hypothetical protein
VLQRLQKFTAEITDLDELLEVLRFVAPDSVNPKSILVPKSLVYSALSMRP